MSKLSIPALAAFLALGAASLVPAAAWAQAPAVPPSPVQATPAPAAPGTTPPTDQAAPPGTTPSTTPGTTPGATPAPGTPDQGTVPGTTPAPGAPTAAGTPPAPGADQTAAPPPVDEGNGQLAVENPYGPSSLWKKGDFVSRGTLIILTIMSFGTWYIMVTKYIEQARMFGAAKVAARDFWKTNSVREGVQRLKETSPFRFIAESGLSASEHHDGALTDSIDLHTWVTMSVQRAVDAINSRLQGGLAFLATVGSTAPFVGLFGTVWGIYHALTAIGASGQASIDKVAGPVGEALIMTAFGLVTAVPAVLGYNFLVRRNKTALEKVRNFGSDLHSVLLSGSRLTVGGTTTATSKAA
jgi:biopolymer transport protein ExbB